ncbi:unnamed protein product [Oppiella nova]|uniref:TM2 domain-containing protein n=1 Tax=Oppiella nova TaxID=334625 RepID=A0A7R9QAP2_9ACAR|nr:unnamed protein product [Oppiella nova]CAG2161968.1 unnamed protein product [Oppiella nova]
MPLIGHYLVHIVVIFGLISVVVSEPTLVATDSTVCNDTNQICSQLSHSCLECKLNYSCVYGQSVATDCQPLVTTNCSGETKVKRSYLCAFCYQLPQHHHNCSPNSSCDYNSRYKSRCEVNDDKVICLGNRVFYKYKQCNFVSGYKWSTALLLSITLGGFGIDRFYLGLWQEGVGKLFSFGGLGVWTLIDVILIATGYLKPSDGSVYI